MTKGKGGPEDEVKRQNASVKMQEREGEMAK